MKFVLDGMQELMEGTANFDEDFFDALVQCFDKVDPILMEGQVGEKNNKFFVRQKNLLKIF